MAVSLVNDLVVGRGSGVGTLVVGRGSGVGTLVVGRGSEVGTLVVGRGSEVGTLVVGKGSGVGTLVVGTGSGVGVLVMTGSVVKIPVMQCTEKRTSDKKMFLKTQREPRPQISGLYHRSPPQRPNLVNVSKRLLTCLSALSCSFKEWISTNLPKVRLQQVLLEREGQLE
ncbi:hypothetical protein BJ508DRAFT_88481 [Ascobolus immersus RN42]|uniref:Uncharacterized protein n=1 Tax=Ascobolus immersus RN42 TaxID=1160509 RepID=A0A3N4IAC1_ASCIM|nr:hypothetical protein BJ508DRAFT_88481 [Ascobolus immersus RN42]